MNFLLTGSSGFLGSSIHKELVKHGKVTTISRGGGDLKVDLVNSVPVLPNVEVVVHCAGKAHFVAKTDSDRKLFYDVNLVGTNNLLEALNLINPLPISFVLISTVAVYGLDYGVNVLEDAPLEAKDPYGHSKIQAEMAVAEWCKANDVICSILRLPLVAGPNPPGNLGAMIDGLKKGLYFDIAGGNAKKSIVLAKDVAAIIPRVASKGGVYNLTDGYHPSFKELSGAISSRLLKSRPLNMPMWIAKIMAKVGDLLGSRAPINSIKLKKITSELTFDDSKAKKELNWKPNPILEGFEEILK